MSSRNKILGATPDVKMHQFQSSTLSSCALLCVALSLLGTIPASAQNAPPGNASATAYGSLSGRVLGEKGAEPIIGAIVRIRSASGVEHTTMSDESGRFGITAVPPGTYSLRVSYGEGQREMPITIRAGKEIRLTMRLDNEVIVVHGKKRIINTTDGKHEQIIDRLALERLPIPGSSYVDALASTPGSSQDELGPTFSGASSLESVHIIDGVNTTGLGYGTAGSPMSNEFIEEIGVITGGYMAEYGRSTGAVINVTTRTGDNHFRGTVFSQFTNSLLQSRRDRAPVQSWIDVENNLAYDLTLGATLGGPIVKDRLWFFVGVSPRLIANDTDRITKRRTDCRTRLPDNTLSACEQNEAGEFIYQDGQADIDDSGFFIYDELDRKTLRSQTTEYQFLSKINYAPSPEHQGQFSFSGTPFTRQDVGVTGEAQAVSRDTQVLTTDLGAKWTSMFNDGKTSVQAVLGMHRSSFQSGSIDPGADKIPHERLVFGKFGDWAAGNNSSNPGQRRESLATMEGCQDSTDPTKDPYAFIDNCPDTGVGYSVGGAGFLSDEEEQRSAGSLSVLQHLEAAGRHSFKAGVDFESNFLNKKRLLSGDMYFTNEQGGRNRIEVFRYVALAPDGIASAEFGDLCGRNSQDGDPLACDYTPAGDVRGRTINLSGYLQDSWELRPNLTLNAGMRYEEQRLRNAEHLQGTRAVGTGQLLGKNAMLLANMWAPRLGLVYDWTKESRSKLYGSWGRYYESIPMDINDRSFGGESWMRSNYDSSDIAQCGPPEPNLGGDSATASGAGCVASGADPANGEQLTGAGVLVAPGTKGQYMDEAILGVEYELAEGLKLGLAYQNRRLGRVLEDLSTDNANTYVLGNPGTWSKQEEDRLLDRIERESDPAEKGRLANQLEQFRGIREFDSPRRDYNALTATLSKRFSKTLYTQASYTYSRSEGNYQGLISSNNGQVDPNISSLFDLPELMANRDGLLPQDRPHYFKLDGYYVFDLKQAGDITAGASLAALSGTPISATGAHYLYGRDETLLLPRGALGRIDFDVNASLKIGYQRNLSRGMRLEAFVDVFNLNALSVLGGPGRAAVDERYTRSNVNPVVGGSYEDLIYLKELDNSTGAETGDPVQRNRSFGDATLLSAPLSARLTARLTF